MSRYQEAIVLISSSTAVRGTAGITHPLRRAIRHLTESGHRRSLSAADMPERFPEARMAGSSASAVEKPADTPAQAVREHAEANEVPPSLERTRYNDLLRTLGGTESENPAEALRKVMGDLANAAVVLQASGGGATDDQSPSEKTGGNVEDTEQEDDPEALRDQIRQLEAKLAARTSATE